MTPQQISDELDAWLRDADHLTANAWFARRIDFRASDGTLVGRSKTEGVLVVDGVETYSAAWL